MPYTPGDILLDKYRIQALLGQGAFGEVYLVTHLTLLVPRAIKVLRHDAPGVGSSLFGDAQARFLLESRLGARLNSPVANPHLLLVYDCHVSEELCLLEMEYASGGSLAVRLQPARDSGQPMPIAAALQIALEVAGGLAALHEKDIIHRDLKPSNILFDEHGHARLADLGLAQVPGGPSLRSQISEPQPHPGTPEYMSPEQESSGKTLKPPSDIYALGLVLFEMLTGRNYTYVKPGTRARELRRELPAALDELLARMLAREPDQRPWDGAESERQLKAIVETQAREAAGQSKAAAESAQRVAEQARRQAQIEAEQAELHAQAEAAGQARLEAERQAQVGIKARKAAEQARAESEARARRFAEMKPAHVEKAPGSNRPGGSFVRRYLPWFVVTFAILLAGGYFISHLLGAEATTALAPPLVIDTVTPNTQVTLNPTAKRFTVPDGGNPSIGPADAPVTIVEFGDYQCPFCVRWNQEVSARLMTDYQGKVRFVYRDFPLYSIHPEAEPAAEAANCAGEQNAYFPYHDLLFGQKYDLGSSAYIKYASDLSLDMVQFNQCLSENRYKSKIDDNVKFASSLGVSSTPTFFVNGLAVVGAQPYEVFQQIIDKELAAAK